MPTFKPPEEVARIARDVLALRKTLPPSQRAGTAVGVRRAVQLSRRDPLGLETIQRMASFFARHEKAPGSAEKRQDKTSKAAQAWALWGGNAGRRWAAKILREQGL